ncbi:MAG: hypothetical protein LBT20_06485, partial [Clostridiales bacterium]|nr:hypothetical protein [Clostridiales bacterium]
KKTTSVIPSGAKNLKRFQLFLRDDEGIVPYTSNTFFIPIFVKQISRRGYRYRPMAAILPCFIEFLATETNTEQDLSMLVAEAK